jgi:hypothetical protein
MSDRLSSILEADDPVAASYAAGLSRAVRDGFGMDDERRREMVELIRAELATGRINRFAEAYGTGALDGLAPYGLYA